MITENPIDLLTVAELKGELKAYSVSVAGKKDELIARLKKQSRATKRAKAKGADMKKAVALLLESYWFGWDDGKPHIFDKMFDKYGTFVPSVGKASSMKGTPDKHTSKINLSARGEGQTVKMLMREGKVVLQEKVGTSPALQEAFKNMSIEQIVLLIENDGKKFEFFKRNMEPPYYNYYPTGASLPMGMIPRWAIG